MNKPQIYLPICIIIVLSIASIALTVPVYSLMIGFMHLIYLSIFGSMLVSGFLFLKLRESLDGENLYKLIASTLLFSFLVFLAFFTITDRKFATFYCETASYELVDYRGRYASGYGQLDKGNMRPNQWIMTIVKQEADMSFVLKENYLQTNPETKEVELTFCRGWLGTEYLKLKH